MIVIDASIAIKWIKEEEEDRELALTLYTDHTSEKETILVPPLFFIEVANSLVTKSSIKVSTIKKDLEFLYNIHLGLFEPDKDILVKTSLMAKEFRTTVYDMLYAIIAQERKTVLVTADRKFKEKTEFSFVKLLDEYVKIGDTN